VKYGRGDVELQVFLDAAAEDIASIEADELDRATIAKLLKLAKERTAPVAEIADLETRLAEMTDRIARAEMAHWVGVIDFVSGLDIEL
jgi:sugar/nucleoside kinase (ribokinase family)